MAAVLEHPSSPPLVLFWAGRQGDAGPALARSRPFSGALQPPLPCLAELRSAAGCREFCSGLLAWCVKNRKMGGLKKHRPPPTPGFDSECLQRVEVAVLSAPAEIPPVNAVKEGPWRLKRLDICKPVGLKKKKI